MEAIENLAKCCSIFQISGLFYFSVKKLRRDGVNTRPTRFYSVIFIVFLILIIIQIGSVVVYLMGNDLRGVSAKNILSRIIHFLLLLALNMMIFTSYVQSFTTARNVKKFFIKFILISQISHQIFQHKIDCRFMRVWLYKTIGFIFSTYLILQSLLAFYEAYYNYYPNSTMKITSTMIIAIIFGLVLLKFIFFVNLVNYYLENLIIIMDKLFQSNHEPDVINVRPKFDTTLETKLKILQKLY